MKIENNNQVLRGPNIWSINRKKTHPDGLNLEEMEHKPTNKIDGILVRIGKNDAYTYTTHRCSPGIPAVFFSA